MNFPTIVSQLVAAVRRDKAPQLLSRRLGFRGNQIRRWESGERSVDWDDFVRLCAACDAPLDEAMRRIAGMKDGATDGASVCRALIGGATQTSVSVATGISRYTILRWLSGKSSPDLADVLAVMHACQYVMLEFIAFLVDITKVPEAYREYVVRAERKRVYFKYPVAPAVCCCLRLDEYQALPAHVRGYVARKLLITVEEEEEIIAALTSVGKVALVNGKYAVTEEQLELTDSEEIRTFLVYWLERSAAMMRTLKNPFPALACGLEVYPASAKTAQRIRAEYTEFYQKVRAALVQDEGPREMVYVFNSQLINFAAADAPGSAAIRAAPKRPRPRDQLNASDINA